MPDRILLVTWMALSLGTSLGASPPARNWPEPVEARLEMVEWSSRDSHFEAELSVEAEVEIPEVEVVVAVSEEVELDQALPSFQGQLTPKKPLRWRISGRATTPPGDFPPSLTLGVRYGFPVKAMRKAFARGNKPMQREFSSLYGETRSVVRSLPLARPPRRPPGGER